MDSEIATKARFDGIRYAQVWEDADVLVAAFGAGYSGALSSGATLVSICSAGDNALALLTLDPARVIALDLSEAQIACLDARCAAYRVLDHASFLELVGARLSTRRGSLFDATLAVMPEAKRAFWQRRRKDVIAFGLAGVGKFERYFRIFRKWLLPIVHSRRTVAALSVPRTRQEREAFLTQTWNSWRWRLVLKAFFSRWAMGRLGRDPAFFQHADGSIAEHLALRIRHAAVDLDPAANPYLHWILHGHHGDALPLAWRFEHYDVIRNRLDRLDIRHRAIESLVTENVRADGFNLSDIFEYMAPETFTAVYGQILGVANPGARLVYWNMMAARSLPLAFSARVRRLGDVADRGKAIDKAFFYSDFHVEEVLG